MKEAILYEKLDNDYVKCHLCAHRCKIAPSRLGICGVRENRGWNAPLTGIWNINSGKRRPY